MRKRLSADEEMELSRRIRDLERRVEKGCRTVRQAVLVLDTRTKRKELTASRHVDRLAAAVRVVRDLRPRPEVTLQVVGLWKEAEEARWALAMSGHRIAVGEARKMAGRGLDHEDLVNEGIVGLLDAAKRFDPDRRLRFSTYARWWVRARMMRAIDTTGSTVRLPGGLLEKLRRVSMLRALSEREDGDWQVEDLAARMNLTVGEVEQILVVEQDTQTLPMTLPSSFSGDEKRSLEDVLADDKELPQDRSTELSEMLTALRNAVGRLKPEYRHVVSLYLGLEATTEAGTWTLQSAADVVGISRERVRQLLLLVKEWVAEQLEGPESRVPSHEPAPPPTADEVLSALDEGRGSTVSVAKRIYGPHFRRVHVESVEEVLIALEGMGSVSSWLTEHRTLWESKQLPAVSRQPSAGKPKELRATSHEPRAASRYASSG